MIIFKKFQQFDQEASALLAEIQDYLKVDCGGVEIFHVYQFKNELEREFLIQELFDPQAGEIVDKLPAGTVCIKDNDGQYNQVQDLTINYLKNILGHENDLRFFKGYKFQLGRDADLEKIKTWLINPVVQQETAPDQISFDYEISDESEHQPVVGFNQLDQDGLAELRSRRGIGLDVDDLMVIQEAFRGEGRDPRFCEIKMLDTYWSDHCRHTTFLTRLEQIRFLPGKYKQSMEASFRSYQESRNAVYAARPEKPITLMDLATINMKEIRQKGLLEDMEVSSEVNACSVEVDIEVNGKAQRWLHLFKNETHNHPTEIEPYGGAHTCLGGGIRDPLSSRAQVIQGMRIVGAGNPLTPFDKRLPGKLAQRYLAKMAMNGFSDYANQIGAPVGLVKEFYDDGFAAKRMELGALVAAVPKENVRREEPIAGDLVILLGAPTGRDGLGAAVGSSSVQTDKSLTKAGAEVQKGNPFAERKIIRLFNRKEATKLIKKCNDFGAGGVSVAIGELADGLEIDLNKVYTKYPGLNGYEIALSESQERMAVVVGQADLDEFLGYCAEEDLRVAVVARVTDDKRVRMRWHGEAIIDLPRQLLNSNGAVKTALVEVETEPKAVVPQGENEKLNQSIGAPLSDNFDSSLGRNKVLCEYGGKTGLTQQEGMVTKFPAEQTRAASVMTYGFFPTIARSSAYLGGYYAVLQSVTKQLALTGEFQKIRLSMQEFFPSIRDDARRMGLPFAALLGAFEVMKALNLPAIGGKDSMSGSFKDIDVPPSLLSFAVSLTDLNQVVSRELKGGDTKILITRVPVDPLGLIDFEVFVQMMAAFSKLHHAGKVLAASSVSEHGLLFTLKDMALGNAIGLSLAEGLEDAFLPGNLVFEVAGDFPVDESFFKQIATTDAQPDQTEFVRARSEALRAVYPGFDRRPTAQIPDFTEVELPALTLTSRKVLIPVLDGATGEYDLQNAFEEAGFEAEQYVIKTQSHRLHLESLQTLAEKIDQAGIVALPHGEYYGAVIKNIAGALVKILQAEAVKQALERLLARDGMLIGIGAGMAALIDGGWFGGLQGALRFVSNQNNRYLHAMQNVRVLRNSYLTSADQREYSAPISGKHITLSCPDLTALNEKVDIIAMNTETLLPGDCGIDMIASKSGRVLGIRSLVERMRPGLYQNIPVRAYPSHFEQLAKRLLKEEK